jgi:CubicO group peptidase (beta-lactamase class C family)
VVATPDAYDNAWARPCGYAFSSVLDMAVFARFLLHGDPSLLPTPEWEGMQADQVDMVDLADLRYYGHGLIVQHGIFVGDNQWRDEKIVWHNGALPGFSSLLLIVPDTGFGIVILANTDGAYFDESLGLALQLFGNFSPPVATPDLVDHPADLDRYLGDYLDPYNIGPVTVMRVGDDLHVSMPLLDSVGIPYEPVLIPAAKQNYYLGVQNTYLPITFILDAAGQGEYIRSRVSVSKRQMTPPKPTPRIPPGHRERLIRLIEESSRVL